jgi:hypothetical protein
LSASGLNISSSVLVVVIAALLLPCDVAYWQHAAETFCPTVEIIPLMWNVWRPLVMRRHYRYVRRPHLPHLPEGI